MFSIVQRLTQLTVIRVLPFAIAAVLFFPPAAHGQEARKITFNEAVRIALEQNITLKQVANQAEVAAVSVNRERMNFYPDLNISTSGSQNYGRSFLQNEARIVNQTNENLDLGIGTSVNLFNGFADVSSLRQARHQLKASELDLDRSRQSIVFSVISNYLTLIERREQIGVQEENLQAQRQLLERIQAFTDVGARPISDLYQQQAEVATAELNLLDAQQQYQIAEVNLVQVLQLDPFGSYQFEAPAVEELQITPQQYDINQMLRSAFDRRADLKASESDIAAASEGIRIAKSTIYPRISLSGGYGTNYSTAVTGPDGNKIGMFDQFDQRRGGNIGVSVALPIFDRFATRYNVQQARVQFDNSRLELEKLQQNIAVEVRQAYLNYEMAEKRLDATEKQLTAARQALEAAQERYNVQAATLVEVTQANATYVNAVSQQVQARYGVVFQTKLIDYYLGTLDPAQPLF